MMSENLEDIRLQIRKFMDTLKVESKLKKQKSQQRSQSVVEDSALIE